MLPTPSTLHVDLNRIYEPSEDSYLLLDTLASASETQFLRQRFTQPEIQASSTHQPCPIVLEVGTGSGVVLAFVTANAEAIFGRLDILALGTDVNPFACQATKETVLATFRNSGKDVSNRPENSCATYLLAALNADLTSPLRSGIIDVLIFNPPYLPSEEVPAFHVDSGDAKPTTGSFGHDSHLLSMSYEGGVDGVGVTNRLLEQLPIVLNKEQGVAYVLLCQQNKPEEVIQRIRDRGMGWSVEIVGRSGKKAGWEKLYIIRIWRE